MYTSYNRDQDHLNIPEVSTKYTDYLKAFDDNFHLDQGKGGRQQRHSNNHRHRGSHPLQILSDNEVKFSNIFSPNESNAIKLQLIQKSSSLPVLDPDSNNNYNSALISDTNSNGGDESEALQSRRRSTASGTLHANANSNVVRKGESVTNILYSTIRHGPEYENPSADETLHTGSDSKVDYDPHEPLPAVDQIALRHELLNNIRAISRATYFEDLYTGKVRENSGSPEGELLRLLENPQQVKTDKSRNAKTIPSKETNLSRVDRWVKESSEASSGTQQTDTDEEKDRTPSAKHSKTSLFHQSMWKEDHKKGKKDQINKKEKTKSIKGKGKPNDGTGTENSYTTESDLETASAYLRKSKNNIALGKIGEDKTKKVTHSKNYYPNGIIESSSQYLQSKYLGNPVDGQFDLHGKKRPFSFGLNSTSNDAPLSVSLPNVAHNNSYRSTPAIMHDTISIKSYSTSRPENLNYSGTNFPSKPTYGKLKKRDLKSNDRGGEQVRNMIPHKPAIRVDNRHVGDGASNSKHNAGGSRPLKPDRKVPGIYARLNLNQWVMKKVWFYVNGDDLYPRFEYRFRQGKDIRDMDQLLDLLTKRFPTLPTGARFVFTTDGYPINSLDEIVNENSYIVSSTRKFKVKEFFTNSFFPVTGNQGKFFPMV